MLLPALATPPDADEYAPFYAGYVAAVPTGDVLATLADQHDATAALLAGLDEPRARHRYAPGKWSVKEMVGHLADTERVFAYRAVCAARGETAALPGFDENAWVAAASFDARPLASLLAELRVVRQATLALYRSLDEAALARRVVANGAPVTARALVWITAGHERHHQNVLRERYGVGGA
jgi:uncharacterized damage-inducible protein DinB